MASLITLGLPLHVAGASERLSFNGKIQSSSFQFIEHVGKQLDQYIQIANIKLESQYKFTNSLRLKFNPYGRFNFSTNSDLEKEFIDLPEAYLEFRQYPARIRIGNNTYNWGVLDGYSPVDVLNQSAYFHPLNPTKLGTLGADLQYEHHLFQLNLVFIPKQRKALFPGEDSRWLPQDFITNVDSGDTLIELPSSPSYYYVHAKELDRALHNNFGAKMSFRTGNWDIHLNYFEGSNFTPEMNVLVTADATEITSGGKQVIQAQENIGIQPEYFRTRMSGASLVWAPEDIILRFETAYFDSITSLEQNPNISPWFWQNGIAIETNFALGRSTLTLLIQGYFSKNPTLSDNLASSSARVFDEAGLIGLRWAPSDSTTVFGSGMYDFKSKGYFTLAGASVSLAEDLKSELIYMSIGGDEQTLMGTYRRNDQVTLNLDYFF